MQAKRRKADDVVLVTGTVVAVLRDKRGNVLRRETHNIVTNAGDLHYAQRCAAETPTHFTSAIMELYKNETAAPAKGNDRSSMAGTLVTGSAKAIDSGYPKTNDTDSDNTGAGTDVVTWRVSYTTGEANDSSIDDVVITNSTPGASEPLLMHADGLGSFTKTASDTLKIFVNHTLNGV